MARERIVLDTNVLISGALSITSMPARALETAISEGELLASMATLHELNEKLLSASSMRTSRATDAKRYSCAWRPSSKSWPSYKPFTRRAIRRMTSSSTSR